MKLFHNLKKNSIEVSVRNVESVNSRVSKHHQNNSVIKIAVLHAGKQSLTIDPVKNTNPSNPP